jgi:magnesium transporter
MLGRSLERTCRGAGPRRRGLSPARRALLEDPHELLADVMAPLRVPRTRCDGALRPARGLLGEPAGAALFPRGRARERCSPAARRTRSCRSAIRSRGARLLFAVTAHVEDWPVARGGSQRDQRRALASYLRSSAASSRPEYGASSACRSAGGARRALRYRARRSWRDRGDALPAGYRRRLARYRYGPGVFKLDWALDGPIPWRDPPASRRRPCTSAARSRRSRLASAACGASTPERPFLIVCQQSQFDATRAPAGRHTGYAYCHVPNGSTVDMTDAIEAQIERFAPGFRDRILARHAMRPADSTRRTRTTSAARSPAAWPICGSSGPARWRASIPTRRRTRASSSARRRHRRAAACTGKAPCAAYWAPRAWRGGAASTTKTSAEHILGMRMTGTSDVTAGESLLDAMQGLAPPEAAELLGGESDRAVALALQEINPAAALDILREIPEQRRAGVLAAAAPEWAEQWARNGAYEADTIGRLMAPPFAHFKADMTVAEAVEIVRTIVKKALVSYAFVVDDDGRLIGVLVFREMLLAEPGDLVSEVMIRDPLHLEAAMPVLDAMREILQWHFPSYPVCDESGRLAGVVRGADLFQQQAVDLSAQAGSMVGVEKLERLATPWLRSFRFRHPWLQMNLLTAFAAAAVVSVFQETIDRVIALAVFLPVLAGQSGNSGSQAMAITLRGMTLGEMQEGEARHLIVKEAWLGVANGALVGITAALGMFAYATWSETPSAPTLAMVVGVAMTAACTLSGVFGVLVPVAMRGAGADPASASSIVLTTITDCVSMGLFLGLAAWLVP